MLKGVTPCTASAAQIEMNVNEILKIKAFLQQYVIQSSNAESHSCF